MGRTPAKLDITTLKKGTKFRYKKCLHHVVDKCDDNGTTLIVAKYFGKYKQWWHYVVFESDCFEELVEYRLITKAK